MHEPFCTYIHKIHYLGRTDIWALQVQHIYHRNRSRLPKLVQECGVLGSHPRHHHLRSCWTLSSSVLELDIWGCFDLLHTVQRRMRSLQRWTWKRYWSPPPLPLPIYRFVIYASNEEQSSTRMDLLSISLKREARWKEGLLQLVYIVITLKFRRRVTLIHIHAKEKREERNMKIENL